MDLTLADLTNVAGAVVLVTILVEVLKRALALTDAAVDRFGPALALGLGVVIVVAATLLTVPITAAAIGQAVLTGLLAGAGAMGLSDAVGTILPKAG